MKVSLFLFFGYITYNWLISIRELNQFIGDYASNVSNLLLKCIDHDRMIHAESTVSQFTAISELSILSEISQIRDEAIDDGKWNSSHEERLNIFGSILFNEHDWELEEVHRYLHEVIETGPSEILED